MMNRKRSATELWREFLREVVGPSVGVECAEYYRRVADWALLHGRDFGAGGMERSGLSVLARLDVRLYLSARPGMAPSMELARLSAFVPKTLEGMAEALGDTLREMVTVWLDGSPVTARVDGRIFPARVNEDGELV
ncbi:hypothetical protein [Corallococcus sp. 4LFB]|uniref:hypothetical protein n=1 Tax=Corallococcus sp. 4LFB TaxID=3383249 RepID=UPI0039767212